MAGGYFGYGHDIPFSAQDAEGIHTVSTLVGRAIGRIVHPGFEDLTARQQEALPLILIFM